MLDGSYYRKQAQLCARLAVATTDPLIVQRHNEMALEQLAKAEEVKPEATQRGPATTDRHGETGRALA